MNNGYYPYSLQRDPAINYNFDARDQMRKYKEEEKHQKAPPNLPFELNNIIQAVGDTFISATEIRKMLDHASQSKLINQAGVEAMKEKVDKVNQILLEISDDLSII